MSEEIDPAVNEETLVLPISSSGISGCDKVSSPDEPIQCRDCGVTILCKQCCSHIVEVMNIKPEAKEESDIEDEMPLSVRRFPKVRSKSLTTLFHCAMCIRSFRKKSAWLSHRKKHSPEEKNFSCFFCQLTFRFEKHYLSHLSSHRKELNAVSENTKNVDHGGKENNDGNAKSGIEEEKKNLERRTSSIKTCHICKKEFNSIKDLRAHIILHAGVRVFPCNLCDRLLQSKRILRKHKLTHHSDQQEDLANKVLTNEDQAETSRTKLQQTSKKNVCTECGESFRQAVSLRIHMASHSGLRPYECQTCKMRFDKACELSRHKKIHSKNYRPFGCPQCGRAFSSKHHMQRHVLSVHLKEKRYACDFCSKRFPTMSNLEQHRVTHSTERPYQCDYCDMTFTCNAYKRKHMNITHALIKPFKCGFCSVSFSSSYHLKRHLMIHSESKPFSCDQCGFSCLSKYALQRHTAVHTGIKPFSCEHCPAAFAFNERLKQHMLTHTQEKAFCCHICGARFNLKCSLDQHTRKHTGEQPFSCKICSRKFSSRSSLSRHNRVHTGVRPYVCEICNKGLSSRRALRRHYSTHQPHEKNQKQVISTGLSNGGSSIEDNVKKIVFSTEGNDILEDGQVFLVPMQELPEEFFFHDIEGKVL
ncbi:zinc finger protein 345-like [Artemia franciscana]|uniref:C2H2-type domain-containing protein n=1 Tax=Artemia franciscana TaxID=6661 RepID=A0AA88L948_ARTSF|nr:hypothetical protein QYM36_003821 [Artemia franciscana]